MTAVAFGIRSRRTGEIVYFTDAGEIIDVDYEIIGGRSIGNRLKAKDGRLIRLANWSPRAREVWNGIEQRMKETTK